MAIKTENIVESIFKRSQREKFVPSLFSQKQNQPQKQAVSKKGSAIGLDIGTNSLKIAKIIPAEQGFILSDLVIEDFDWELIDNQTKKKELLPKIIKEIIEKHNLPNRAFVSISPALAQIKNIHLAPMPRDEIEQALKWEIQQVSSKKIEEFSFDYLILNEGGFLQKEPIDILAVIAAKSDILEYMQLLESAGLKVMAVDVDPLSAVSCLNFMGQINAHEIVIFLEIGAGVSTISVIENNKLGLIRNVTFNANSLTSLIKQKLNINSKEAEQVKKASDCLNLAEGQKDVCDIIKVNLESLILDIEHTFKYYSYQLTRSRVGWFDRIVISGGCCLLANLDKYLSKHLETPVQIADPLRRLQISDSIKNIFPDINLVAPRLSVCIGLALRGQIKEI